jgi:hypothetical protein
MAFSDIQLGLKPLISLMWCRQPGSEIPLFPFNIPLKFQNGTRHLGRDPPQGNAVPFFGVARKLPNLAWRRDITLHRKYVSPALIR